ncbi:hypothetical protein [Pseudomonas indica]|uniref:Pyrroloquinoline quinone biosynthesis protein PqqE n=1 Tax=Pseudomonas indica TaxID=137658 RepID=A0A1G9I394_9PSED|nr:hypothetical protein [Pseudomonas indica]MBU3059498.1 hypothetical protein [Pseudomonas indica]SDL19293.1 hypothetical protein SAMN05216186_11641 [Pseudomonas indica]
MQISSNVLSAGVNAFQAGQQRADRAAAEIAAGTLPPVQQPAPTPPAQATDRTSADLATSLVELRVGETQAQAGAKVIETADEVLGTLIDTHA